MPAKKVTEQRTITRVTGTYGNASVVLNIDLNRGRVTGTFSVGITNIGNLRKAFKDALDLAQQT